VAGRSARAGVSSAGGPADDEAFSHEEVVEFNIEDISDTLDELLLIQYEEHRQAETFRRFVYILFILCLVLGVILAFALH
jgi:hypothetical protein